MNETNQNILPLLLRSSKSLTLGVFCLELCFGVCHNSAAGNPIRADATTKMLSVNEKPKYAIPIPDAAPPIAVERNKTAVFLVASFSSRFGDNEKI